MRFYSFGFLGKSSQWFAVIAVAALMSGCSEDPGLQERLNRLQAEMQEKDRQLQEAQSALERAKSELKTARAASANKAATSENPSATNAAPRFLPREQIEESYASASKAMQKRISSELRNYSVENCTQFPVTMPTDETPYHSKIVLGFRSDNGRSYRLEFPVSADASGKWTFPNSVDIAGALAESSQQDQTSSTASNPTPAPNGSPKVAQNNATPAPTSSRSSSSGPQIVPGQAATETRVIDWGGGRTSSNKRPGASPAANNNAPPAQQPTPTMREAQQPTPQQNKPTQTMQSDKDVTIHW